MSEIDSEFNACSNRDQCRTLRDELERVKSLNESLVSSAGATVAELDLQRQLAETQKELERVRSIASDAVHDRLNRDKSTITASEQPIFRALVEIQAGDRR